MKGKKNVLILLVLMLAGLVIGGLLAELTKDISFLSWLSYGKQFGLGADTPFVLDLSIIRLTFGIGFKLDVAGILGLFTAFFCYRKFF